MVRKIIFVFKTHFDIGFTDLSENVIRRYGNEMLREVLETCEATADMGPLHYVWTMPSWPLSHILKHGDPALLPRLHKLIENGQIVWHSLPFTSHTDFSAPDEYARTLMYARELSERFGKPLPRTAKMTDVPGHGLMLPEVLCGAGISFLHLGANEFSTPPELPELFFWETPSGKKLLTMYSKGGYGTGLIPPEDWPYPVWMALMHTQDNCGPQSAEVIRKLAEEAREKCPGAEIVCGSMEDFYAELEKCDLSAVPVVREDLADTWIHGVGSYPRESAAVRRLRERERDVSKRLLARLYRGESAPEGFRALREAYTEAVSLYCEHTWGADVKTWLGPNRSYPKKDFLAEKESERYRFMERSWQEQRDRVSAAEKALEGMEKFLDGEGTAEETNGAFTGHFTLSREGDAVYMENGRYRLLIGGRDGLVREVFDRRTGCALLAARAGESVFGYRYDRVGFGEINEYLRQYGYHFTTWGLQDFGRESYPLCERRVFRPEFTGMEEAHGEREALVLSYAGGESAAEYGNAFRVELSLGFSADGDKLCVSLALPDKQETPYVEAGSLVMPLAEEKRYALGRPGGVIDPVTDIREKANHSFFGVERGLSATGAGSSVFICAPDTPLVAIGSPGIYEYRPAYGPAREPVLYFNLFNNMWGTNFPQWIGGSLRFDFMLEGRAPEESALAPMWAEKLVRREIALPEGVVIPEDLEPVFCEETPDGIFVNLRSLSAERGTRTVVFPGKYLMRADLYRRPFGERFFEKAELPCEPGELTSFILCR